MSALFADAVSHSAGLLHVCSISTFSLFFKSIRAPPVKFIVTLQQNFIIQEDLFRE